MVQWPLLLLFLTPSLRASITAITHLREHCVQRGAVLPYVASSNSLLHGCHRLLRRSATVQVRSKKKASSAKIVWLSKVKKHQEGQQLQITSSSAQIRSPVCKESLVHRHSSHIESVLRRAISKLSSFTEQCVCPAKQETPLDLILQEGACHSYSKRPAGCDYYSLILLVVRFHSNHTL